MTNPSSSAELEYSAFPNSSAKIRLSGPRQPTHVLDEALGTKVRIRNALFSILF